MANQPLGPLKEQSSQNAEWRRTTIGNNLFKKHASAICCTSVMFKLRRSKQTSTITERTWYKKTANFLPVGTETENSTSDNVLTPLHGRRPGVHRNHIRSGSNRIQSLWICGSERIWTFGIRCTPNAGGRRYEPARVWLSSSVRWFAAGGDVEMIPSCCGELFPRRPKSLPELKKT